MNTNQPGFTTPTFANPSDAFLASVMANAGIPWPRKPLSGKPALSRSAKNPRTARTSRITHPKRRQN